MSNSSYGWVSFSILVLYTCQNGLVAFPICGMKRYDVFSWLICVDTTLAMTTWICHTVTYLRFFHQVQFQRQKPPCKLIMGFWSWSSSSCHHFLSPLSLLKWLTSAISRNRLNVSYHRFHFLFSTQAVFTYFNVVNLQLNWQKQNEYTCNSWNSYELLLCESGFVWNIYIVGCEYVK